jgi:hypothetical protein
MKETKIVKINRERGVSTEKKKWKPGEKEKK